MQKALADIPYRKGVNNHMGSRITPDQARMTWVLEEIKAKGCFFVDSRTERDSVAQEVARDLAMPTVERQVFLDDDKGYPAIARQWERTLALARNQGQVLAIGHIYPETVAALEKLIPAAKGQVTFVYTSALVDSPVPQEPVYVKVRIPPLRPVRSYGSLARPCVAESQAGWSPSTVFHPRDGGSMERPEQ